MARNPHPTFYVVLRLIGILLSGFPVLLTLVASIAGSLSAGRFQLDFLLPAELFFLTIPGIILLAVVAVRQKVRARLSVSLALLSALLLLLPQALALISGIASGRHPAQGPLWILILALLLLYDLTAVAAPVVGLLAFRQNPGPKS